MMSMMCIVKCLGNIGGDNGQSGSNWLERKKKRANMKGSKPLWMTTMTTGGCGDKQ